MADRIRTADPQADRVLLTDLLAQNLTPDAGGPRFEWLYLANPHGKARAWVATESATGRGIGAAAAFPRRMLVQGSIREGYVLGDFCIDQQHRSLGLAIQLQRACLEQVATTSQHIAYDFPSDRMMAIYRRMQISPAGQIVRWAKPLRANRQLANILKYPALAGAMAVPLNALLKWRDSASFSNSKWTVTEQQGSCNEEFTQLAHSIGTRYGSCVERSAEYLNWRYLRHPLVRHQILTARQGAELRGYVVFSHTGEDAKIVDLFGFSDTAMWAALVARVVRVARDRGVATLSFAALSVSPWSGLLKTWGFHPREAAPVVVYGPGLAAAAGENTANLFLMDGDRES